MMMMIQLVITQTKATSPNEKGGDEKDAEFEKANRGLTTQLNTAFELLLRNLVRYPR